MWDEWRRRVFDRRLLGGGVAAAIMVGVTGPFGTFTVEGLGGRILFWSAIVLVSLPIAVTCRLVVEQRLPRLGYWPRALVVCTAFTLLYTPVVQALVLWRLPAGASPGMTFTDMLFAVFAVALLVNLADFLARLGLDRFGTDVPPGLGVGLAPAARWAGTPPASAAAAPGAAAAAASGAAAVAEAVPGAAHAPAPPPRLMARLPPELRGAVRHVTVNDHYVVVRTDRGEAEVLLRFADALAELEGVEGRRVHRSHWVARAAVAGVDRERGRAFLRLVDGTRVPVSRRHLGALDTLGLAVPAPPR